MKIYVKKNEVLIDKTIILNDKEYKINKCEFELSEEYNGLVQKAVFTWEEDEPFIMDIVDGMCDIPIEVLHEGILKIGVYAYETNNDELVLRYSPSTDTIRIYDGSYVDNAQNSEGGTPSEFEQLESKVQGNTNNISSLQNDVENIESEQTVQNQNIQINADNIQTNTNDISNIKQEQATQNEEISQNTTDIDTLERNLANYSLITETGSQIALNINSSNYQMTAILKDKNGNTIYTSNVIDLPIESMIIDIDYDEATKEIVFTLQSGTTLRVSVADLVSGLVSTNELNTILANYYTKTEIDTLLSAKANSSDVYTKNETDALLGGKVDTTTYTQGQATQDANIEENASNIESIESLINQMPTVSGQGTDISLQDVLNYRFMKFVMKGNSSQFSTTGKNLLNPTISSTTKNGVTLSYDSTTQEITLNGTCDTNNTTFNFVSQSNTITANATTYSLLKYISGSSTGKLNLQIFDSGFSRSAGVSADNGLSADITNSISYSTEVTYSINRIRVDSGSSFTNLKFQVYLSTVDSEYELFTGKIPAPNPSYPYPVKTVTGENILFIRGKNLFDGNNIYYKRYSDTILTINNDDIIFKNRHNGYAYVWWNIPIKIGKDITISYENMSEMVPSSNDIIRYTFSDTIITSYDSDIIGAGTDINKTNKKATVTPTGKYLVLILRSAYYNQETGAGEYTVSKLQVEYNETNTAYVAGQSQIKTLSLGDIELNSSPDGTIRDAIIGTPNNWYKRKCINKITLNGSESGWSSLGGTTQNPNYVYYLRNTNYFSDAKPNPGLYCNYFNQDMTPGLLQKDGACRITEYSYFQRFFTCFSDITTVDDFKAWLSTHNTIVYYVLAQYTDIPITDTTLISQLNDIYNNAHSYNGTTNITTTYASGNEQMYLDVEALMDLNSLISRIEVLESEV